MTLFAMAKKYSWGAVGLFAALREKEQGIAISDVLGVEPSDLDKLVERGHITIKDGRYFATIFVAEDGDVKTLKAIFNEFRIAYRKAGGTVCGLDRGFKLLQKHKDWRDVVHLLLPALQRRQSHSEALSQRKLRGERIFVPNLPNLSTYINARRWEDEFGGADVAPKTFDPRYEKYMEAFKGLPYLDEDNLISYVEETGAFVGLKTKIDFSTKKTILRKASENAAISQLAVIKELLILLKKYK